MKKVLITGAAGDVASYLRRELAGKYQLVLSDKRSLKPAKDEKFIKADISKMADAVKVTKGVHAVVHLGGYSVEGPWEAIHQANIVGCYNVFEAARRNKVKRMLFATSNHAVGFYRRAQTIDHRVYPKPDGRYGVLTAVLAGLGRAAAEVGAILIVGGNIAGVTRTMTTAIALETSKGELGLALALGLILITLVVLINAAAFTLARLAGRHHR